MCTKKILISILILFAFYFSGYAKVCQSNFSFSQKNDNPIDSSYGWVDSILIEYFVPANASMYYYTFNKHTLKVWSGYSAEKIIINKDSVNLIKNLVASLFITGSEKTEIGKSYNSGKIMSEFSQIRIRLFAKGDNYLTHQIYTQPESATVEFSKTFHEFYDLLKVLSSQLLEVR